MNQPKPPFDFKILGVRWPEASQTGFIYPPTVGAGLDAVDSPIAGPGLRVVIGKNNAGKSRFLKICASAGVWRLTIFPQQKLFGSVAPFHASYYAGRFQVSGVVRQHNGQHADPSAVASILQQAHHVGFPAWREKWTVPADRYFEGDFSNVSKTTDLLQKSDWNQILMDFKMARSPETWRNIQHTFRRISNLEMEIHGQGVGCEIVVRDHFNAVPRKLHECGDGLRDLIAVLLHLYAKRDCDLFIDEPGTRLHPSAQRVLLSVLEEEAKAREIWIATHDAVFANAHSAVERYAVHRAPNPADPGNDISTIARISTHKDLLNQRDALGWMPSDAVLASHVLYCEGDSDAAFLRAVLEDLETSDARFGGVVVTELGGSGVVWRNSDGGIKATVKRVTGAAPHAYHVVILDDDYRADGERHGKEQAVAEYAKLYWLPEAHELEDLFLDRDTVHAIVSEGHARACETSGDDFALPPNVDAIIDAALLEGERIVAEALGQKKTPPNAAKRVFERLFAELKLSSFDKTRAAKVAAGHLRRTASPTWVAIKTFVAGALELRPK